MQVKKFEAKTMKEALELVKIHLGPEAIIISAKNTHRGFGIMGETSVEVTAAVSDETLRKKKIAESKLREDLKTKFHRIPATKQKEFINRVVVGVQKRETSTVGAQSAPVQAAASRPMYNRAATSSARAVQFPQVGVSSRVPTPQQQTTRAVGLATTGTSPIRHTRYADILDENELVPQQVPTYMPAKDRVKQAAQRARAANVPFDQTARHRDEVQELQSQVRELKGLVEKFQKMPQVSLSMHPGADFGLPFEMSSTYQRMVSQGVESELVAKWMRYAQKSMDPEALKKPSLIDAWLVQHLLTEIKIASAPDGARYHVFVGSTGQGKSTTLVKLAAHLVLKERRTIAIVSMDTVKLGASDQLKIFAQILNVPFAVVRQSSDWPVAEERLKGVQHILVDCPGFGLRSAAELTWLKSMLPPARGGRQIHYVQSVLARNEDSIELAGRYQAVEPTDMIFTRLDESSGYGLMLNMQNRFHLPIHSFGLGVRIPEDFELASKERLIEFLFRLTKVQKREAEL